MRHKHLQVNNALNRLAFLAAALLHHAYEIRYFWFQTANSFFLNSQANLFHICIFCNIFFPIFILVSKEESQRILMF